MTADTAVHRLRMSFDLKFADTLREYYTEVANLIVVKVTAELNNFPNFNVPTFHTI